jgi:hypothetical protein
MPLPKGMAPPVPRDYVRVIDRPSDQKDPEGDGRGIGDDDAHFDEGNS